MLRAVRRVKVSQGVASQLAGLIRQGRLGPGERLPSERELAGRLGVSRASLREGIRGLERQGLVVSLPGRGTFVSTDRLALAVETFTPPAGEQKALRDAVEVRLLLEPQVAALAARRATPKEVQRMASLLDQQEGFLVRGESGAEADVAFHLALARAAHNTALLRLAQALVDVLAPSRDPSRQSPERTRLSLLSHRRILAMVQAGDPEGAREAMEDHIRQVDQLLSLSAVKAKRGRNQEA